MSESRPSWPETYLEGLRYSCWRQVPLNGDVTERTWEYTQFHCRSGKEGGLEVD